ncbi:HlyD family secretion protein [Alphaproteobacteria bacterium]|nr:HlyD family secretion protein [Alphaproteobacteria bacterium]
MRKFYFIFFISIIVLLAAITYWQKNYGKYITTDNAYIRGSITNISSRIEGYVETVPGVINTQVRKGDILVKFEKEPFLSKYEIALAEYDAAKAKIKEIESLLKAEMLKIEEKRLLKNLSITETNKAKAKKEAELSSLKYFKSEKERFEKLFKNKTITKSKLEKTLSDFDQSFFKVEQFDTEIKASKINSNVIEKEILKLEINIEKLKAEKLRFLAKMKSLKSKGNEALIDLQSTNVVSPVDGIIANRVVEPGVYVKNGRPMMSIVPIEDVWVIANFKETQVNKIKIGQNVKVKIDAYSDYEITGKVLSLSPASASSFSLIPPQNASGNFIKVVQRIPVKITIEIPDELKGRIVPGLSTYVKVLKSIN